MYRHKFIVRLLFFVAECLLIIFSFYYVVLRDSSPVELQMNGPGGPWKQRACGTCSEAPAASEDIISMDNCPEDWPLEVVRREDADNTYQIAQVCRKKQGVGEWMCAPGWSAQVRDQSCVYTGTMHPPVELFERPDVNEYNQVFGQISDKLQLVYIHIPHTGGNFVENSILFDDSGKTLRQKHFDDDHKISDMGQDKYKNYHKFSVVRHPCSRLISAWKYLTQGSTDSGDKLWTTRYLDRASMTSFEDFVMTTLFPGGPVHIENQVRLRTQVSMLFDDKGQFRVDQLLVYEKWNESMTELGSSLHIDTPQLFSSSSGKEKLCKEMYTPSSWLKMTQIYSMDFCVLGYSRNIDQISNSPPLNRSQKSFSTYFKNCTKSIEETLESQKQFEATKVVDKKESCVMYTYFQKQYNISAKDAHVHNETINVWKTTWSQAGWTPRILTEDDAKKHPEYDMFYEKFFALPTINTKQYEMACFMRHVAMAAVGGGWMSDYDVIPLRMPRCVEPLNGGRYTVYEYHTPCLVSGSGDEFTRVSKMMSDVDWRRHPELTDNNRPHVSDMHLFSLFVRNDSVIPMRVVIEAKSLFTQQFVCNRTWPTRIAGLKPIPSEFTLLPWVIHFAHASFGFWREENISSLWPESSWNGMSLRQSAVRPIVMRDAYAFLRTTCKI